MGASFQITDYLNISPLRPVVCLGVVAFSNVDSSKKLACTRHCIRVASKQYKVVKEGGLQTRQKYLCKNLILKEMRGLIFRRIQYY